MEEYPHKIEAFLDLDLFFRGCVLGFSVLGK